MLSKFLKTIIAYTPEARKKGSMWWWLLPFAPGVPERRIVGHERAFLTWFCDGATAKRDVIGRDTENENLRTFSGKEGVLGALGVYRAAFETVHQTEPLQKNNVKVPLLALGGEKGLGQQFKR